MVIEVCATWLHASAEAVEQKQPGCTGQPKPRNKNNLVARASRSRGTKTTWLHASAEAAEQKQPGCTHQPTPRNENNLVARASRSRGTKQPGCTRQPKPWNKNNLVARVSRSRGTKTTWLHASADAAERKQPGCTAKAGKNSGFPWRLFPTCTIFA